ncbi:hypothetical protein GCM10027047_37850 [Rhodococcus aerolatus]
MSAPDDRAGDRAGTGGSEDDLAGYGSDLAEAQRRVARSLEPGGRGLVVGVAVLVLIASMVLPHSGAASGWDVLLRDPDAASEGIGVPSQLFVGFALGAGVLLSVAAVLTRRWAVAWLATAGCAVTVVLGVLAIWSRQTTTLGADHAGPGPGLLLGWLAVLVLTVTWVRLVWSPAAVVTRPDPRGLPRLR